MNPGVTVAQLGSRRDYAVAVALHRRGMLAGLLTDLYCPESSAWGALAAILPRSSGLSRRRSASIPADKVSASNLRTLGERLVRRTSRSGGDVVENWIRTGERFCRWAAGRIPSTSRVVYAFTSAALELFQEARDRGMGTILDHATAPITLEADLVDEAWYRWPQWFHRPVRSPREGEYAERQRAEWNESDRILCGSGFVRNMVIEAGGPDTKCRVVPLGGDFGFGDSAAARPRKAAKLRVAFVGDDGLRKGLPDALEACRQAGVGSEEFRIAGVVAMSKEGEARVRSGGTMVGRLNRAEMRHLFDTTDILLLPTVSDTFGLVVLEAMSRGCIPLVSDHAGAAEVIEEGVSGFVVPIHSPALMADRITRLTTNTSLRSWMSEAARMRARDYSVERYGERLVAVVKESIERVD